MQKENTKQRAGDNDERGEWLLRFSPMVVEDLSCTLRLILQSLCSVGEQCPTERMRGDYNYTLQCVCRTCMRRMKDLIKLEGHV